MFMNLVIVHKETLKYIRDFFVIHIIHEFSNKVNKVSFRFNNTLSLNNASVLLGLYPVSIRTALSCSTCNFD